MGLTWEIQPFWCILEPFHPPSPCTSSASDRKTSFKQVNNRKPQKTNGNEWREGYNSANSRQHEKEKKRIDCIDFTSYSFTISGTWSFSSNFCCLFSSVSMQWWQQRIFSSSFSSSMEVTLLRLLMLPLLEPIPLLPPPAGGDTEWTGLPGTHRASRVPLISFSVNRPKASHFIAPRHIWQNLTSTWHLMMISYCLEGF